MTNEELLVRVSNGDEAALTKLCLMNTGLVKDRARLIARQYHCLRQTKYGGLSDYAKEMLSELESVGRLALVECVRSGDYDAERGRFTTYVTPFLDGAMRRYLECSMGTLSLDRDSMGLVRKAQKRYHQKGESVEEISQALGISFSTAARAIAYPTHFFSVYDTRLVVWVTGSGCDSVVDHGMPKGRIFTAFQEGSGDSGTVFRRVRPPQVRSAGNRHTQPHEEVWGGES